MSKEDMLYISRYNDIYGKLLTPHQCEMIRLYYDCDVSLFEISEQLGISRQAVRDTIKRAEELLIGYEHLLGLESKTNTALSIVDRCNIALETSDYDTVCDLLSELKVVLEGNNGII